MFQVSLAENNVKFDFGSGDVDFWEFAQALKKNIDMNIAEGNHLVYHRNGSSDENGLIFIFWWFAMISDVRIADDRVKDGKDDKYDVNV